MFYYLISYVEIELTLLLRKSKSDLKNILQNAMENSKVRNNIFSRDTILTKIIQLCSTIVS